MLKTMAVAISAMFVMGAAAAQQGPSLQIVPENTDADDTACGTMGDRIQKQLAESIRACLADLKY